MSRLFSVRPRPILRTFLFAASCALLLTVASASAQTVTTGNLAGTRDAQGGALPGHDHCCAHGDWNQIRDGHRRAGPLRHPERPRGLVRPPRGAGGLPPADLNRLEVALGERELVDVRLQVAAVTETVEVVATPSLIDSSVAGTGANVSNAVKETLPPSPAASRHRPHQPAVQLAGQRRRRRRVGGVERARASATTPCRSTVRPTTTCSDWQIGGCSRRGGNAADQPRRHPGNPAGRRLRRAAGGFAGGGINAITKSGSNAVRGTAFYFGRNQSWVGDGADDRPISEFKDKQFGAASAVRSSSKAFFFGTADYARKLRPTGFSVNSSGQQFGNEADVNRVLSILQEPRGYSRADPLAEFGKATDSDKHFVRTDFNLGTHQLRSGTTTSAP